MSVRRTPDARCLFVLMALVDALLALAPACPDETGVRPEFGSSEAGVVTWKLMPAVFNGAVLQLDRTMLLSGNLDKRLKPQRGRTFSCKSNHSIQIWAQPCGTTPTKRLCRLSGCRSSVRQSYSALARSSHAVAELGSALPTRECQDVLNFRGNGPEDARLLPLGQSRMLVVYNDYAAATGGALPYRRTIYVRELSVAPKDDTHVAATLGPIVRVNGDRAQPPLGDIEKNWSPFVLASGGSAVQIFVHRWLDRKGEAIVHQLDLAAGRLGETLVTSNGRLREVVGGPPHTDISGGTPAVRLNHSHFVAFGHTMTMPCALPVIKDKGKEAKRLCLRKNQWRAYALFGYLFESTSPFRLVAATPEFRIMPPTGKQVYGYGVGPPTPAITSPTEFVRGALGKPQFPVGLSLDATGEHLLLSTGYRDVETILSWINVPFLMQRMQRLR